MAPHPHLHLGHDPMGNQLKGAVPPKSPGSSPATPSSGSPEKSRFRSDAADDEVSQLHISGDDTKEDTRELPDSIDVFPIVTSQSWIPC